MIFSFKILCKYKNLYCWPNKNIHYHYQYSLAFNSNGTKCLKSIFLNLKMKIYVYNVVSGPIF